MSTFSAAVERLGLLMQVLATVGVLGPARVIFDRSGRKPYLSRFYLRGAPSMPDGSSPYNETGNPKPEAVYPRGVGIYLHRFHQDDEAGPLHSHPFSWMVSLILLGGYREERMTSEVNASADQQLVRCIERREYRPGDLNVMTSDTFHRVDLLEGEAWSLFIVGDRTADWGFWDRVTGRFTHWRSFIESFREEKKSVTEVADADVHAGASCDKVTRRDGALPGGFLSAIRGRP